MTGEVGRPSELDSDLLAKIRTLILDGKTDTECQEILGISPNTWKSWAYTNYRDFRTNLRMWDNELLIAKAKANLHQLLGGDDDRIRADLTKFTLETLNKVDFSKKTETDITSGGNPIYLPSEILSKNEINSSTESDS